MAVKIRLTRMGRHKRPFYRIVVADTRMPRDGKHCDVVGTYNTLTEPAAVTIDKDKILNWLSKGAQMSATVSRMLKKQGILSEFQDMKSATTT